MRLLCALVWCWAVTSFGESPLLAQALDSSRLPVLVINVEHDDVPDEPKVTAYLRLYDRGDGSSNQLAQDVPSYEGWIGIEQRGASSRVLFPKTGYGIELRTAAGADTSASLLGLPDEEDWVLHGPYSDKSLVRNALAYGLAGDLMPYAPRTRWVELVLGDDYRGLYLFTEKIKRDRGRVDISKLKSTDLAGDSLSGGYILKFDKGEGGQLGSDFQLPAPDLPGARPSNYVYHYPKQRDIQPEQVDYIQAWFGEFERRLASEQFDDPELGYAPLVDMQSFVHFFLVNEVGKNVDGYRLSTYFYKDRDDKDGRLHMGPVWDFNLAFGNAYYCDANPVSGWMVYFARYCPDDSFYAPFWWPRLLESRLFRKALVEEYHRLQGDGLLSDAALTARVDSLVASIPPEVLVRNFDRWPVLGEYVWPNVLVPNTHEQAVGQLKFWLDLRLDWMDRGIALIEADTLDAASVALGFRLSPNPGTTSVQAFELPETAYPAVVQWIDMRGAVVATHRLLGSEDWSSSLPTNSGLYTVELVTAQGETLRTRWQRR